MSYQIELIMNKQIPILLVTGFLGAGKTTFLNWLIQSHPDLKISLILNEFGDIKLESQFIKDHSGGEIAELSNGCMCCLAKSDIPRVINFILENSPQTEYIIIEASGLSDPDPIRDALRNDEVAKNTHLESTLCIVDALNFENIRREHAISMSQVGDADIIIISKVKEAGYETTTRVKNFIESIGVGTKVLLWDENLSPELFLIPNSAKVKPVNKSEVLEHHHEHEKYDEFWFKSDKQLDLQKFTRVMNTLPDNVIRSKGYINAESNKIMVQYVAHKLEVIESEWKDESPHSAVLFLGKELDLQNIQEALSKCEIL